MLHHPKQKTPVKTTFRVWCLDKFLYPWEKGIIAEPSRGDSLRIQLTCFADLFAHDFRESLGVFGLQARLFDEPQLAALCLESIDKNTPEALSADGFTDIDIDTLAAVLDRDSLRIKESRLFSAVLK